MDLGEFNDYYLNNLRDKFLRKTTVLIIEIYGSSHSEVFLRKGFLKICSKFTGECQCRSVISI